MCRYLSHIDLNREHGRIGVPHQPTLRAATPVYGDDGAPFGVVVINMDMAWAFARAERFCDPQETLHVADERGGFLRHPDPGVAFSFEPGSPLGLDDTFPGVMERLGSDLFEGFVLDLPGREGGDAVYLAVRAIDPLDLQRRLVLIVTEPLSELVESVGPLRRESLLWMAGLLLAAIVLVVVMVRRQTASLAALARAADGIAAGEFPVPLPRAEAGEVGSLVRAFEQCRLRQRIHGHRSELVTFGRLILGAEIASTAAHQLSQPIAAMSNYASAAMRLEAQGRLDEAELNDMLGRIERLSVRAGEILDKLRSRIRRLEQQRVAFDLNRVAGVAASCLDFFHERIDRSGIEVERDLAAGLPAMGSRTSRAVGAVYRSRSHERGVMAGVIRCDRPGEVELGRVRPGAMTGRADLL